MLAQILMGILISAQIEAGEECSCGQESRGCGAKCAHQRVALGPRLLLLTLVQIEVRLHMQGGAPERE